MLNNKIKDMNPEERSAYFKAIRAKVKNPGGGNGYFAILKREGRVDEARAIQVKAIEARNKKRGERENG